MTTENALITDARPASDTGPVSRAGVSPVQPVTWIVEPAEKAQLRAGVGALVRFERSQRGRTQRWLARATGANVRTIERLESGERRPSPSFLRWLAGALDPEDPKGLGDRLIEAAGSSLAADTPGKARHWYRRAMRAYLAGARPFPTELTRQMQLHREASRLSRHAYALLDRPGALDDYDLLREVRRCMDDAKRLRELAGPPFTLVLGPHRFEYGMGL